MGPWEDFKRVRVVLAREVPTAALVAHSPEGWNFAFYFTTPFTTSRDMEALARALNDNLNAGVPLSPLGWIVESVDKGSEADKVKSAAVADLSAAMSAADMKATFGGGSLPWINVVDEALGLLHPNDEKLPKTGRYEL